MEIKGTLLKVLPTQSGEGKNGSWSKYDILIQQEGQHGKPVCVTIFGGKPSMDGIGVGSGITAEVNVESREFNGKYYTNITAWKIEGGVKPSITELIDELHKQPIIVGSSEDDLPF